MLSVKKKNPKNTPQTPHKKNKQSNNNSSKLFGLTLVSETLVIYIFIFPDIYTTIFARKDM